MRRAALALALSLAACESSAPEAPMFTTRGQGLRLLAPAREARIIVALKTGLDRGDHVQNQAVARQVASSLGVTARRLYGTALVGFAATVPAGRVDAIRTDPRVAFVSEDRPISISQLAPPAGPLDAPPVDGGGPPILPPEAAPGDDDEAGPPPDPLDQVDEIVDEVDPEDPGADVVAAGDEILPWGVSRIGADEVGNEGMGVHVYVLDTGIDVDHPELAMRVGMGFAAERCQGTCAAPWDDDHGHGTHVSGTIAAARDARGVVGIAPMATLHPVKVLASDGFGEWSGVVAGIDWVAMDTRARFRPSVANLSLSGGGFRTGTCTDAGYNGFDALHAALCNAKNRGVLIAVAAGNDGVDAAFRVPAAYSDAVITVSATQFPDDWPWWSNWGNDVFAPLPSASGPVTIAAPGVNVLSTVPGGGYAWASGTSMAAPHVAGALALYLAVRPLPPDGNAFTLARRALLQASEATQAFANTSGRAHSERFLDASGF